MNQTKKTALITGASEGIGLVFAKQLILAGYTVTLVARRASVLEQVAAQLGSGTRFITADLSTTAGADAVCDLILEQSFDLVINNAGVGVVGAFSEASIDRQLDMLHLNIESLVKISHAYLNAAKSGNALINVSSTLAFSPMPGIALYSATKAFVTAFSDCLWYENKHRGIYVMGLCPGATSTRFQVNAGGKEGDVPKNIMQTPEQVVDVAMAELRKREKPTVVSGNLNRFFGLISRALPRKAIVTNMGRMAEKTRLQNQNP